MTFTKLLFLNQTVALLAVAFNVKCVIKLKFKYGFIFAQKNEFITTSMPRVVYYLLCKELLVLIAWLYCLIVHEEVYIARV